MTQICAGALLKSLSATFWLAHLRAPHLMVYGLLLHAYGLSWLLTAARNLHLQSQLDHGRPLLEMQHRIAELRTWRLREALIHGIGGCFMWIPLVLIGFQQLGADLWLGDPSIVWSFVASGAACLGILYGVLRWPRMSGHGSFRARLEQSSIGRSVLGTQAMLDEIAQFERD